MSVDRIARLRELLEEPLLVTSSVNVRYLTGFESSNAALLVEPGRARLFTDFRYAERARALTEVELVVTRRDLYAELPSLIAEPIEFEPAALTYARYELLTGGGLELTPRAGLVEAMRAVKDDGELEAIRRAAAAANEAFAGFAEEPFVGCSEKELAWRMETLLHEAGGEELSFPPIVASGPTGGWPHAIPGDRKVGVGETIVVDAGCRVGGYCSDCTRTFVTGELPDDLAQAYDVVRRAQEIGLALVCAGADSAEVDWTARDVIEAEGLGAAFGHGLGHGVGLEVHEPPWLNAEWPSTLAVGNVVTVEPGVYLPGRGGVRIEDLVIVTGDGAEVLTSFTELVTVA